MFGSETPSGDHVSIIKNWDKMDVQGRLRREKMREYELGSRREMSADPRQIGSTPEKEKSRWDLS